MQATELFPLESLRERLSKSVTIKLNGDCTRAKLEALWDVLTANQGDRPVAIEMHVQKDGRTLRVSADVMPQIRVQANAISCCTGGRTTVRRRLGHPEIAMPELLDFEEPIGILLKEIEALSKLPETEQRATGHRSASKAGSPKMRGELYRHLTPWQRVLVARHPSRPTTLDYVERLFTDFVEIRGDRRFADDHAIIAGLARYRGEETLVVGHQKGSDTKQKIYRNFGYARPEGYRKALRAMQMAQKFRRAIICFVDTPAAYPGIESEERGVAEAIALNLREMSMLPVPVDRRRPRRRRQRRRPRHRHRRSHPDARVRDL